MSKKDTCPPDRGTLISATDWIFAGTCIAAAVLFGVLLWTAPDGAAVTIRHEGKTIGRYLLSEEQEISVHGAYDITFRIEDGTVYVAETTCPGGQCQAQGRIFKSGDAVVCVPNEVSATVEEAAGGGVDAATG